MLATQVDNKFYYIIGLSEDMYEDGFENIINIDISNTVAKYMDDKLKTRCPNMGYRVMDVMDMSEFKSGEFNSVIDKGTLDSILCGDNSVANAEKMITEVFRVLQSGGVYLCITYGAEDHRKNFLVKTLIYNINILLKFRKILIGQLKWIK